MMGIKMEFLRTDKLRIMRSNRDNKRLSITIINNYNDRYTESISIKTLRDFMRRIDIKDREHNRAIRELIEVEEY
jgi:hypothetical protein